MSVTTNACTDRLNTELQRAHRRVGMASVHNASGERTIASINIAGELREAGEILSDLTLATSEDRTDGLIFVAYEWSTEHGPCEDCGGPAAYSIQTAQNFCCVCAASRAADGEVIHRLSTD